MSTQFHEDLSGFHGFLTEQLHQRGAGLAPEEALDLWRAQHPLPDDYAETVTALRQVLAEMASGDVGAPLQDFDREFRS